MNNIIKQNNIESYDNLVEQIGSLLANAREQVARQINNTMVYTYWGIGQYIVEFEQSGEHRAEYGKSLLNKLSKDLTERYGKGFNRSGLQYMRKLYVAFPICTTLSCKLSWSHYIEVLKSDDTLEIQFYIVQCEKDNWSVRELQRQMKSMLFHRLALSKNKDEILSLLQMD